MNELYPLSQIIELARKRGIYLGRGTPRNRIAYFVKTGLIPHAIRKTNPRTGKIEAHFPISILEQIEEINHLKRKNYSPYQIKSSIVSPLSQEESIQQVPEPQNNRHLNLKFFIAGFTVILIAVLYTNFILGLAGSQNGKVLGIETFVAPALEESAPLGSLLSKIGSFFRNNPVSSFALTVVQRVEQPQSSDLTVSGKAQIAKDIEGLGNLKIQGTATIGKLVTGIVDPYLIENDGSVQSTLEIRSTGDIKLEAGSSNIDLTNSSLTNVKNITSTGTITSNNLAITNNETIGGTLTTEGTIETKKDLKVDNNITLTGVINSDTLTDTKLVFAGSSPSIYAGTTNTGISLNANGTGAISIGNSSKGDIYIGGGSTSTTYCLITNSSANLNCGGDITAVGSLFATGGSLKTTATTGNLFNTTATTLNIGGVATAISIGASTGTTTINNGLTVTGTLTGNTFSSSGVTITGGSINSTTIGATTTSTGAFTTLSASSTLSVTGATTLSGAVTDSSTLSVTGAVTLTTALTVGSGGTGDTTLTSNGVLYGQGTSAIAATSAGTSGQLLLANSSSVPTFVSLSSDATLSSTGALTLASTGVTAASYGSTTAIPVLTIDAKGRITSASTASISSAWSSITNPSANLSLSMAAYTTTFTWNAATGASTNLFTLTDTSSNTGTGYLLSAITASLSNLKPFQVQARGNTIIDTTATGGVTIGNSTSAQNINFFSSSNTITSGGVLTLAGGETITSGGLTITAGGEIITAGGLTVNGGTTTLSPSLRTSGSASILTITGPLDTTLTAAEANDVNLNLARTVQFTGSATAGAANITTQRAALIQAPTYAFSSTGAQTITNAATLAITGAPSAGTNATITNPYALWIQGGTTALTGNLIFPTDNTYNIGASGANRPQFIYPGKQILNVSGSGALPSYAFSADNSSGMYYDSVNGGPAFATGGVERWFVANAGHLQTLADNTYDIGASGANRPRDLYLGRNARFGGVVLVGDDTVTRTAGSINFNSTPTLNLIGGSGSPSISLNDSNNATVMQIIVGGGVRVPNVGTTASAANAFLDSTTSNNLLRSTSSLRYKNLLGNLSLPEAQNIILNAQPIVYTSKSKADNPNTVYVGFAAEQIATVDARFITYDQWNLPNWVQYPVFTAPLTLVAQNHEKRILNLETETTNLLSVVGLPTPTPSASPSPTPSPTPTPSSSPSPTPTPIPTASILSRLDTLEKLVLSLTPSPVSSSSSLLSSSSSAVFNTLTISKKLTTNDLGITGTISSGLLSIKGLDTTVASGSATINTISNDLYLQNLGVGGINFLNGKVLIDKNGNLTTQGNLSGNKLILSQISNPSAGSAVLPANSISVNINTNEVTPNSKIFLTATTSTGKQELIVGSQTPGTGFTVRVEQAYTSDITFNWWILDVK